MSVGQSLIKMQIFCYVFRLKDTKCLIDCDSLPCHIVKIYTFSSRLLSMFENVCKCEYSKSEPSSHSLDEWKHRENNINMR